MNEEYKSGNSKRGRWTKEEQNLFNFVYQWHGNDWKKLSELIQTRTILQIRSHAQKIQKKLEKNQSGYLKTQKVFILDSALGELNEYISNTCSSSFRKYIEHQNTLMYSQEHYREYDNKNCDSFIKGELNSS